MDSDPLIGQIVSGRYRILEPLGEGGMGQVYLGEHEAIEKKIALKVLRPEYSAKEDIVTRFQQEAISASRIKHPNVLEVFDFGKLDNGCAYLAMEFLAGNDVADELATHGFLTTSRAIRIMLQVCRALAAAHKAGVVHRDMKPDNVFLQRPGDGEEIVKIVDFGIAQLRNTEEEAKSQPKRRRLTKTGMIFGTPEYMAPEQAAGKQADLRVDVYASGIILFEMLTGAVPFTGDSFMAVLAAHLNDPPPSMLQFRPDLGVSQELHDVVKRALAKKPDDRFQSMSELAGALLATPEGNHLQSSGDLNPTSLAPPPPIATTEGTSGHGTSAQFRLNETNAVPVQSSVRAGTAGDLRTGTKGPSHTLEAATSSGASQEKKSGSGVWIGVGGGVLVVLGVSAFLILPGLGAKQTSASSPTEAEATQTAAPSPPIPSADPTATVAPATAPAVEPANINDNRVTITIETVPKGALVKQDGFQVCGSTPCSVEVEKGEGLQLDAVLGKRKGKAKVLALKDQTVTMTLRAPAPKKKEKKKPKRLCEVPGPGGLKVWRECK